MNRIEAIGVRSGAFVFARFAVFLAILCGWPDQVGGAQATADADHCSIAVSGGVSNSRIEACARPTNIQISGLENLRRFLEQREPDPELLRLLDGHRYDAAIRRIAALVAAQPQRASEYHALASAIHMMRFQMELAVSKSRLAYEDSPNDFVFFANHYHVLSMIGRDTEAQALLAAAHRRRGQFGSFGSLSIETIHVIMTDVAPYIDNWFLVSRTCSPAGEGAIPIAEFNRLASEPIARCQLDAAGRQQVLSVRTKLQTLVAAMERETVQRVETLNLRLVAGTFERVASVLLRDAAAVDASNTRMSAAANDLYRTGGPWAILQVMAGFALIDQQMDSEVTRAQWERYDQALADAAVVPATSYDPTNPSVRGLRSFNSVALGTYQFVRSRLLLAQRQHESAWRHAATAARSLATNDDAELGLSVRLLNLELLQDIAGALPPDPGRFAFASAEHRELATRVQRARADGFLAEQLVFLRLTGCAAGLLNSDICSAPRPPRRRRGPSGR